MCPVEPRFLKSSLGGGRVGKARRWHQQQPMMCFRPAIRAWRGCSLFRNQSARRYRTPGGKARDILIRCEWWTVGIVVGLMNGGVKCGVASRLRDTLFFFPHLSFSLQFLSSPVFWSIRSEIKRLVFRKIRGGFSCEGEWITVKYG